MDTSDLKAAEDILNRDHSSLDKVKKRILEFLAVRFLKGNSKGSIICLCGPPGVGKTSLGNFQFDFPFNKKNNFFPHNHNFLLLPSQENRLPIV